MVLRPSVLFACCLLALPFKPAQAQTNDAMATGGDFVILGAGLASLPDYEGSNERRIVPVPGAVGRVDGFNFFLVGNRASIDFIKGKPEARWDFQLGPVASLGFNRSRLKDIADRRVRALPRLGYAVELGGFVGIARRGLITSDYDQLSVTASYRKDVFGAHDGALFMPSVTYMTPLSRKAMVTGFASATHADRNYMQSNFSISPAQSGPSGLPVYEAQSGWKSWSAGAAAAVSLTGDLTGGLSMVGGLMYMKLLNSAAESPVTRIAGTRDQWFAGLGLAYTF